MQTAAQILEDSFISYEHECIVRIVDDMLLCWSLSVEEQVDHELVPAWPPDSKPVAPLIDIQSPAQIEEIPRIIF